MNKVITNLLLIDWILIAFLLVAVYLLYQAVLASQQQLTNLTAAASSNPLTKLFGL